MKSIIYLTGFIITLVITPIMKWFALNNGFSDKVNGDPLKIHKKPVALLGGSAVAIATVFGILVGSWELGAWSSEWAAIVY